MKNKKLLQRLKYGSLSQTHTHKHTHHGYIITYFLPFQEAKENEQL